MFRQLMVGALIIVTVAGLASSFQDSQPAAASPSNVSVSITFASAVTQDGDPVDERIEFGGDNHVWAIVDFTDLSPGAKLSYILRVNKGDFNWGKLQCCGGLTSGRFAFQLEKRNGGAELPGGAYRLFIYDGDTEIGQAGFGVRGTRGLDNGNANSNRER